MKIYWAYYLYIAALLVFVGSIFLVPIMALTQDMGTAYSVFSYTCHQKISRSICYFSDNTIGDCTSQEGKFIADKTDRTTVMVEKDGKIGYKFPVCARDIGLYGAMLIGAIFYPFFFKLDEPKIYPAFYLILAIVPLGLDGSVQLVSELGFLPFTYESTNLIRLITGAIAGIVASFYAVPLILEMSAQSHNQEQKKNEQEQMKNEGKIAKKKSKKIKSSSLK